MPKGKEPTPKQKAFADEFLKCGNQTEAAKRAGYSEKTARQAGAENMKKPVVLEYMMHVSQISLRLCSILHLSCAEK